MRSRPAFEVAWVRSLTSFRTSTSWANFAASSSQIDRSPRPWRAATSPSASYARLPMAMAYWTSTRLADSDSENIPDTNSEVSPSRRKARARAAPSSSSASWRSSARGRRWSDPSSSRTRSDSVCRKPDRRFARYSSVACCTRARWFSMARERSSRKNSWIDWADRTFGSVIHTSSDQSCGGACCPASSGPLDSPLPAPGSRLHWPPLALSHVECQKPQQGENPMKNRPLQDRVIVKRVQEEEKTKGGIIIPDTAKEKPIEGQVIAVRNGKILEDGKVRALDIKAGDRVLFSKYAGTEIKIDGQEHLMMREEDILGVIEK